MNNKVKATPAARKYARVNNLDLQKIKGSGEKGRIHLVDTINFSKNNSVKITSLAKRIAQDLDINVETLSGTGYNGKITKDDLNIHKENTVAEKIVEIQGAGNIFNTVEGEYLKLTPMRSVVAKRMTDSFFSAPSFTMNIEVDVTKLSELRKELIESVKEEINEKITVTDFVLKASSKVLRKHPMLNAAWTDEGVFAYKDINIALAVGLDEGLYVPVIKNADKKTITEIVKESKELGRKATNNKLKPSDQEGNTFTISSVGMYGITSFTPILNMPSSAILGVGTTTDRVVPANGGYETRSIMTLSLTVDHRVVDGAPAAKFLKDIKEMLENPYSILI